MTSFSVVAVDLLGKVCSLVPSFGSDYGIDHFCGFGGSSLSCNGCWMGLDLLNQG